MMSYAKCFQHLKCNITTRGKEIYKRSAMGLIAGAASGAALGGLITGCRYGVIANSFDTRYREDHYKEYPGCDYQPPYKSSWEKYLVCTDPAVKDKIFQLSYAYRDQCEADWLSNVVPMLMCGLTLGGAALGLVVGFSRGWCTPIPVEEEQKSAGKYQSLV